MMIRILGSALCALLMLSTSSVNAQLIDDFSGDLSNFTNTLILDAQNPGSNTAQFVINGDGQLEIETTSYDGIEQYAFIYNGLSLEVGQEVVLDVPIPLIGDRNFGLYVGGTEPVTGVFDGVADAPIETRQDYITCYSGLNNFIATRGFDGTDTEYPNTQFNTEGDAPSLFIAQPTVNTFDVGFYNAAGERTVFETRNPEFPNAATFVGIYADVREAGTVGTADNFRIQPIPSDVLVGDIDMSTEIDFRDITPFIALLTAGTFQPEADINGDNEVSFLDIVPFIQLLTAS